MTTITITVQQTLDVLKKAYRRCYGYDSKHKVTKKDIAAWLGALAEADVQDYE